MTMVWMAFLLATAGAAVTPPLTPSQEPAASQDDAMQLASETQGAREERLAELRQRAKLRIDAEAQAYSAAELADIEARYTSAFRSDVPEGFAFLRGPEAEPILEELVRRYPRSNRAGCALLLLAQLSTGARREQHLRRAIDYDGDAWFENGVQVGALARAMLAIHLAGLDRLDGAERIAAELVARFPGAIDQTGASLDDTLSAIRLLRPPRGATRSTRGP